MDALDKDKNGELSAEEIENASAALKSLDKNSDGKLDEVETRPNFEAMGRGGMGMFGPGPGNPAGEGAGAGNSGEMVTRLMAMDANKDGKLSKDEVPERLQSMMARGDKNEDGALDKDEIMAIARERSGNQGGPGGPGPQGVGGFRGGAGVDFVAQMMERADVNKDGKLSGDEVPPFMRERLSQIDSNNDGALDKAELEAGAARMRQGRGEGQAEGRGRAQRPPVEDDDDKKSE
jgi:Ca2+-binding EF-hand superfamily protein